MFSRSWPIEKTGALERSLAHTRWGSMPIQSANSRLNPSISIAKMIITYGQLSKPYLQPCLNPVPRFEVQAPGLLEPFLCQIWIHVSGWGWITGLGSCAFDLGCGIGGGGVSTHSGLSQEIIKLLVAKINKNFLFLPVIPVMAIAHMKIQLNKIWLFLGPRAVAKETILIGQPTK